MKHYAIAGFAAGAAMMIGGALAAVSGSNAPSPQALSDAKMDGGVMNPMVAGQAMLPSRTLMDNISASPVICPLPSGPGTIILEPWKEIWNGTQASA